MHRTRFWLLAVTLLAVPGYAAAEGPYFGIQAGALDTDDVSWQSGFDIFPVTIDTSYEGGTVYGVTLGRDGDTVRFEAELARREDEVESLVIDGSPLAGPAGAANATSLMLNFYYDFGDSDRVTPYIGGGFGVASLDFVDFGFDIVALENLLDDDADVFAYQAILGAAFQLSDRVAISLDGRIFETEDADLTTSERAGGSPTTLSYAAVDVRLGVRFAF